MQLLPGYRNLFIHTAVLVLSLLLSRSLHSQSSVPPVGQWRDHLNYQQTTQVVSGDKIYCAAGTHVFSVDNDNTIGRYTKTSGLNDIGVACIGWNDATQQLVIAYNNSNLDVLGKNAVRNIGDIKRSTIAGDKTIRSIFCSNAFAYLCTGLGIVIADLAKYEIKDTWIIGANGRQAVINALTADNSFYYAATDEGLKAAPVNSPALSNYTTWQLLSGNNGLPAGAVNDVCMVGQQPAVRISDSVYIRTGNSWQLLYTDAAWSITGMSSSGGKLLVCQRTAAGASRVIVLAANGTIERTVSAPGILSFPRSALLVSNALWVADQFGGLSRHAPDVTRFIPNGPPGTADGEMLFSGDTLFAAAGSVNSAWNYQYNRNGVYRFANGLWDYRGYFNTPVLDSVLDFITLAIDPADRSVWAGSYGGGLVHFNNSGSPSLYKKNNSTLQPATGDPGSYRVSGLAFDGAGNLWISNYGAAQNLQVRKKDGSFKAFTIPFTHTENAVARIVTDDHDQLWIQSPKDNGVFCYNYGQSIDNTNDDKWKWYRQGSGNGNLPGNNVLSLAKDKDGFIWVGTDRGIGIIRCTGDVFTPQSCEATLAVVQQDRFTGLLFKDESVQTIAVDGANRKWVGTKNGAWLISPDGEKVIYRFTAENSPLLANDVKQIAINPLTGEVFFATASGTCSFMSTATEGGSTHSEVLVFPNPVPPGYNGSIAIKGLAANALVKITEMNGRLVYQGRSLGGQLVWNGRDYLGNKAASGVYLVFARNDAGTDALVTKIVIVSGR